MARHRFTTALGLVALMLLGRGAVAFAYANAHLDPVLKDPARVAVSDISGLSAKPLVYTDAMDDVRRALVVLPRHTPRVAIVAPSANDQAFPQAHRPRAPPIV
jgi:hypothetical protein